ncbi:hypothetical protein C8R43DRAFT_1007210 [Mycena crocata]|nr:hypothetical protein C8R43DRAFT_1007210 [Mycena crocata]
MFQLRRLWVSLSLSPLLPFSFFFSALSESFFAIPHILHHPGTLLTMCFCFSYSYPLQIISIHRGRLSCRVGGRKRIYHLRIQTQFTLHL